MSGPGALLFIVGRPRTGTTALRTLLTAGGAVDCGEILHPRMGQDRNYYRYLAARIAGDPLLAHPSRQWGVFDDYIGDLRRRFDGAPLALDMKIGMFDALPSFTERGRYGTVDYLREHATCVFHVVRRNRLRAAASFKVSEALGVWSANAAQADKARARKRKVTLDPVALKRSYRAHARQDQRFAKAFEGDRRFVRVVYEQMFTADGDWAPGLHKRIAAATGMDALPARPTTARLNPEPLRELVANLDEVAAALRDTPHAWMLEGELSG